MCARTQFMTDSFLWAECPIMSKTNETMKHNAEVAQFRFALIAPVIQGLFPMLQRLLTTNGSFHQSASPWMKIYMFFLILSFCFPPSTCFTFLQFSN